MKVAIVKETAKNERRVALVADDISRLKSVLPHAEIVVEKGAGAQADSSDNAYTKAGAKVVDTKTAWASDAVLKINPPSEAEIKQMKKGAILLALMDSRSNPKLLEAAAKQGVEIIALERVPRTSRAQSMDVLSSQANLGGYRAVLEATQHFNRLLPLMMTAAGSAKAARVAVLGVGVAGLQAIATAKRLGAVVEAFDVRPEVAEQITSLGAKVMDLGLAETGAGEGGYAKELSEEGKKRQQEALQQKLPSYDIIITTAQIPGRPAPVLVTKEAVAGMKAGTVIIDMAAASGGNCPLTEADKVTRTDNGVVLVGHTNYPAMVARDASQFFGRNLINLIKIASQNTDSKSEIRFNADDDILAAAWIVRSGQVQN